jgi:3-deoxy-manno-octulosonate cytidylyltransferase (CMP-KDO synthetase)
MKKPSPGHPAGFSTRAIYEGYDPASHQGSLSLLVEYRKNKRPFHQSRTADDCCCIARKLCNVIPPRSREAMLIIEKELNQKIDVVVMIQGDEPLVTPEMIEKSFDPIISDEGAQLVILMSPLNTPAEMEDPNEVKVVVDQKGYALYFSREPTPSSKKSKTHLKGFKQLGIIPFKRDYLAKYDKLTPTKLEKIESVDMLRVLEHGDKIKMVKIEDQTISVDTKDDLMRADKIMLNDQHYLQ